MRGLPFGCFGFGGAALGRRSSEGAAAELEGAEGLALAVTAGGGSAGGAIDDVTTSEGGAARGAGTSIRRATRQPTIAHTTRAITAVSATVVAVVRLRFLIWVGASAIEIASSVCLGPGGAASTWERVSSA